MIDDPIVLILFEAAARGRQLRLAREHASSNELRLDDASSEAQSFKRSDNNTAASQRTDNVVENENLR